MAKLRQPVLMRVAGGVLATAVVGLSITAVGVMPAQAAAGAPSPITGQYLDPAGTEMVVPAGVNSLRVVAQGGSGGSSNKGVTGGAGANVSATITVAPGDAITIYGAGNGGKAGSTSSPGAGGAGYLNGGTGGNGSKYSLASSGAGGGGAAAILINGAVALLASGGGGAGGAGGASGSGCTGALGANAALLGTAGYAPAGKCAGKGTAGAASGSKANGTAAKDGAVAGGGGGAGAGYASANGGGGGGFGGGGGGGGGAGSSFLSDVATNTAVSSGAVGTAGQVSVSYTIDTTTTVVATPNPAFVGQTIAYTINTTVAGTSTPVDGPFTLYSGACGSGTVLGNGLLVNGTATVDALFAEDVCASFDAAGAYNGSEGTASVEANLAVTTTSVSSDANLSYGEAAYVDIAVRSAENTWTIPSGFITYTLNGGDPQTANLDDTGRVGVWLPTINVGDHVISATYGGDALFAGSLGAASIEVHAVGTGLSLESSVNPSNVGQETLLTATVTANRIILTAARDQNDQAPGQDVDPDMVPTGDVEFSVNGEAIGTVPLVDGMATLPVSNLAAGTHSITAFYAAHGNFGPSESTSVEQQVEKLPTTFDIEVSPTAGTFGDVFTATADIAGAEEGLALTGTVQFRVDGIATGAPATVNNGQASLELRELAVGTSNITAIYSGNESYRGAEAAARTVVVTEAAKPEPKPEPKPEEKPEPKPETTPQPEAKPELTPEPKGDAASAPKPVVSTATAVAAPSSTITPTTKVLANTGATGGGLAAGACALLGLGVALVMAQRRRTSAKH